MTAVKICGIKTLDDALAAAEAGAGYLGFNFYPRSVRCIDPAACARITAVLRAEYPKVRLVGIFVNVPAAEIRSVLGSCGLDLAQLHGDEGPEVVAQLAPLAFKAYRGGFDPARAGLRAEPPACLLDAAVQGAFGGTGATADWNAAAGLARQVPLFLAGGLNPGNVAEAVRQVRPWGVDTASGVESSPGVKDAGKIRAFIAAVRAEDGAIRGSSREELEKQ
ncbi:MAG TPA: phosphoribosylanthranilate isomerase [Anaerolineaceae bacterium]